MAESDIRHHCKIVEGTTAHSCNYCHMVIKGGGITRVKYHLAGNDPKKNVRKCDKCPPEVREQMKMELSRTADKKKEKARIDEVVRQELRAQLRPEFDEVAEFDDDPEQLRELQRTMKRSRQEAAAAEWRMPSGSGSGSALRPDLFGRSTSVAHERIPAPSLYRSDSSRQKRIPSMMPNVIKKFGKAVSRFFIFDNVAANKVKSPHFRNMIAEAQEVGPSVPLPSPYEILNQYLQEEVDEINEYVDIQRRKWRDFGCTIMVDGWTGPTRMSIINVMVYCAGKTVFLRSVDASDKVKDADFIYGILKDAVTDVGKENVVQIVTDNGSAYKSAGKRLSRGNSFYWTPCAAHCIDLMFEDIGKRTSVAAVINDARLITKFIYNHGIVLAKMRDMCAGDIVRPGVTRFATNYLVLQSIRTKKSGLRNMFTSTWWDDQQKLKNSAAGRFVEEKVTSSIFWAHVDGVCALYEPMYNALRLVDTEVHPTLGLLNHTFILMKAKLEALPNRQWAVKILEDRWERQLSQPLHEAAHFLNPKLMNPGDRNRIDLMSSVSRVYEKLFPLDDCESLGRELVEYRDATGGFSSRSAMKGRENMASAEWWNLYGHDTPSLRKLAMRILAQTASSSACERNWSTFALIHTKQRNRLAYKRLERLVFCSYNMKLQIRDKRAQLEGVETQDPLDTIQRSMDLVRGEEGDDEVLLNWIRPINMDDDAQNPDPQIASVAASLGVDVDRVLTVEVGRQSSFDSGSTGHGGGSGSGEPSGNDGGASGSAPTGGWSPWTQEASWSHATQDRDHGARAPYTPWTEEADFTHATQDMDHGARDFDSDYYRGRQRRMSTTSICSSNDIDQMSSQFGSLSFTPAGHDTDDSSALSQPQPIMYELPVYVVIPAFPIPSHPMGVNHDNYAMHINNYMQNYQYQMSWDQYCMWQNQQPQYFQPPRHSTWY